MNLRLKDRPLLAGFLGGILAISLLAIAGAQPSFQAWANQRFLIKGGPPVSAVAAARNIAATTATGQIPMVIQQRTGAGANAIDVYANGANRFSVDANGSTILNGSLALRRNATTGTSVSPTAATIGFQAITTTGAFTVNLPAISGLPAGGVIAVIKDVAGNANTNNITIDGNASETIDGATTKTINTAYGYRVLFGDSTGWWIIASG